MNKFILIFLYVFYLSFSKAQSWTQLTDFPGTQRDDGTTFTINNKAYCFSGLEVGWQCTGNGYSFDAGLESWSPIASLPIGKERQYATAFSYNGIGYMLGGLKCDNSCLNDFWQYSVVSNTWTALPNFPGSGRQGMINFVIKDKVYIIGGRPANNIAVNEVWEYNFTTTTWVQKNNIPLTGMWRGAAFAIDTVGYICYGMNSSLPEAYNHNMYRYDYINDTWFVVPNIVLPSRNYIACAVTNKKACLYGGHDTLDVITNDIKLFNPADTSLTTYVGVPTIGRKGTMSFSLNDVFYITTGLDATQNRIKETWKNTSFVGIKEYDTCHDLKIYPNPSSEILYVDLNKQKHATIKLANQLGQTVYEEKIANLILEIDTSHYPNGIYYLSIQSNGLFLSKKVIICH